MQITETGVATVTNVESSENSASCKSPGIVQDQVTQLDIHMSETVSTDPGANSSSEVITKKECDSTVHTSESAKLCSKNANDEIDGEFVKTNGLSSENGGDTAEINGSESGILDQADTTSVENLSIVTVVEKELEIGLEVNQSCTNTENINGHGKCIFFTSECNQSLFF